MYRHETIARGEVWLVGAGPGDPDLLTRKAERLLKTAEIVFHDALVGLGVLDLIPSGTNLVSVGKRSGRHSKSQDAINGLMVEAALAGRRVVRLKGGDPSIFGRSAEEMEFLSAHGIAVHVCPGVTAASAAAAGSLASLTLRGLARRLTFVTAHARAGEALDLDWRALADPGATTCFYMGREAAGEIALKLIEAGLAESTPVLVAIDVSLPQERLVRGTLGALPILVRALAANRPTLLIVGEAVGRERAPESSRAMEGVTSC